MQLKPEELTEKGFMLLDKLEHKEIATFVSTYINKKTKYAIFYYFINICLFGVAGYLFSMGFNSPNFDIGSRFTYFAYGLAIAFALIPLHEYIHVLAYKSQGATHTSLGANFKKLYFLALADKFVANKKEFEIVALAPFITITTTLIIIFFFANANWTLTIVGTLLTHTAMCAGDFGLLSYFQYYKDKEVVTYDDVENKISYFYGKVSEKENPV